MENFFHFFSFTQCCRYMSMKNKTKSISCIEMCKASALNMIKITQQPLSSVWICPQCTPKYGHVGAKGDQGHAHYAEIFTDYSIPEFP